MDASNLPQMPPWAIVGIIIIGCVTILPLGAAVLVIGTWVGKLQTTVTNNDGELRALRDRCHDLANALSSHKQEVATDFVRHGALEKLETTLMGAINQIGSRIDQVLLQRTKE